MLFGMSGLQPTEAVEIGGLVFNIGRLPFGRASAVYTRLNKVLHTAFGEDKNLTSGVPLMFAGMAGALPEEDLKFYCAEFGKVTTVDVTPEKSVLLRNEAAFEQVFGAQGVLGFEDVFVWLDHAIRMNFSGAIEKMRGALAELAARAQEEAASKGSDSSPLPG